MIGKTHSGAGFGGLTRYLLQGTKDNPDPGRVLWTSTRELALEDPRDAALLMRRTAALGRTDKPAQHLSISLAPGEHLTREQWETVIDTTLRDLGLERHQALIVAHQDTDHEHIHLVVNRVHPETLRAWNRWQDRPRLMASLRAQEMALGLRSTPHVENPDRVASSLVRQFERSGEPPLLDYARAAARPVFQQARSWSELHEGLAEQGLYLERKGQGLVVTDDHRHVKASSVDRSASLRALEARLGPFELRRPLLEEVDHDLRSEPRQRELAVQVARLQQAGKEASLASATRHREAQALDRLRAEIHATLASAYRNPAEVAKRYFDHLHREKALPPLLPAQLGELKRAVLHVGRNYLPLGAEGQRAFEAAAHVLPRQGAAYLQAQADLARFDVCLADARRAYEQLSRSLQPQVKELRELEARAERLPESLMALRPRDQIAVARKHGAGLLDWAAKHSPGPAGRTVASREWWMQNLSRDLDRALDRRLSRARVPAPARGQSPADWAAKALHAGLRPLHAIQILTRGGIPLADATRALSLARVAIRNPAKTAILAAAQAMGLPTLPVRLAAMGWALARDVVRVLSR